VALLRFNNGVHDLKHMNYEVKSGTKLFNIIETVQKLEDPRLIDIATHLDFPKSTVHNHLGTLKENGYLKEEDGVYDLTLKFLDHGIYAKQRLRITHLSEGILEQLAEDTNEAAWLMIEERGFVVGVEKALGERGVQTSGRIGRHTRFHYHAPGKAILAHLSPDRVDEILAKQGLPQKTEHTITDRLSLEEELSEVREEGVAFDVGEAIDGIRSVAAPVICDDTVEGAIGVVGPKNRLRGDRFHDKLPELVSGAANELELRLRYDMP
jgi:DNA-binding IclR family transcriptional regulator